MNANATVSGLARYSWVILAIVSLLSLMIGIGDFLLAGSGDPALTESMMGVSWSELKLTDPQVVNLVDLLSSILGAWFTGLSILGLAVSAIPFRRGERWAWYALWALPLAFLLVFVAMVTAERLPGSPNPPALYSAPILFLLSSGALLLTARPFLSKGGDAASSQLAG